MTGFTVISDKGREKSQRCVNSATVTQFERHYYKKGLICLARHVPSLWFYFDSAKSESHSFMYNNNALVGLQMEASEIQRTLQYFLRYKLENLPKLATKWKQRLCWRVS